MGKTLKHRRTPSPPKRASKKKGTKSDEEPAPLMRVLASKSARGAEHAPDKAASSLQNSDDSLRNKDDPAAGGTSEGKLKFFTSLSKAPMKRVPFIKYTSYGNNFVIVDETRVPVLTESEKSRFAFQATSTTYGVGSDNFLILQPCKPEILKGINKVRRYWDKLPDSTGADYIFRMFEPDGEEAFSCGNGLMCMANYLHAEHGIESGRIMTEIPTSSPRVVSIGTNPQKRTSWANMGHPRRIPPELANPSIATPYDDRIDMVKDIPINNFRRSDAMRFFTNETSLTVSGYLVFTGEPHFIIFTETGFSLNKLGSQIFISSSQRNPIIRHAEKRMSTSSALVDFIGRYFDREYSNLFPAGINIDFVRIIDGSVALEYRCFERGINRETLACGTGALAATFVAQRLNMLTTNQISVWPHRCRWHDPKAEIQVEEIESGWLLYGDPVMLFEGAFFLR